MTRTMYGALLAALVARGTSAVSAAEPLPSWNDGPARRSIVAFVENVTREGGPGYVPPAERVAVFDNDGTLWAEQPLYFQFQKWHFQHCATQFGLHARDYIFPVFVQPDQPM